MAGLGAALHRRFAERQHRRIGVGLQRFGRLTGDETGGLGNLNFDVGPGRLFGSQMGAHIAWLLPGSPDLPWRPAST